MGNVIGWNSIQKQGTDPNPQKASILTIYAPNDTSRNTIEPFKIMNMQAKYTQTSHKNKHLRITFDHEHIPRLFDTFP